MPPRVLAFRGEMTRTILQSIRQAGKPIDTLQLARQVMAGRGLNTADARTLRLITKLAGAALRHLRLRGVLRSTVGPDKLLLWEIAG